MIRRPPRSTPLYSSAASDVYKRQLPAASLAVPLACSAALATLSSSPMVRPPCARIRSFDANPIAASARVGSGPAASHEVSNIVPRWHVIPGHGRGAPRLAGATPRALLAQSADELT